jgi:hypothetical protein
MKITHTALKADSFAAHLHDQYDYFMFRLGRAYERGRLRKDDMKIAIGDAYAKKVEESQEWYINLCKEKDAFLVRARKRIDDFPPDYRPRLIEAYHRVSKNLNSLFEENANVFGCPPA